MASATPPNGLRSPTKPQDGGQRVPVAIPLHYPNHRRANSRAVSQETTTSAKSEKSDAGSGDERHTAHGGQHPMTPESLSSSIHKPEESSSGSRDERLSVPEKAPDAAEHVNGFANDTVSMPPLEPQLTLRPDSAHNRTNTTAGAARTNGYVHHTNGSSDKSNKTKPRSNSKPLRVLQAPPPEFHPSEYHPSEPSSTPLSANSSHMGQSLFYPAPAPVQNNNFHTYAPQMPPRPVQPLAFNPEAHFQPLDHLATQMSRSPSHTSSADRPVSGGDIQSPMMPLPSHAVHEMRNQSAAALQDHMLKHFDCPGTSDLAIVFSPHGENSHGRKILAHTLVVQRSKKLWQMTSELKEPSQTIYVEPPSHFMTEIAFVAALRYLYGAPLWIPENIFAELSHLSPEFSHGAPPAYIMSQVLGYAASGHYLGLPEVVQAGLACARHLQSWDTVAPCLAFALDGGISNHFWRFATAESGESDDGSTIVQQDPTCGQAANYLLHDTLVWIAMSFPPAFQFVPTATQLPAAPRLPTVVENRPSQADPRLSLIQFGDMGLEHTGRPDYLTVFISSILISLPFAALQFLFDQPGYRQKPLDHQVIAEAVIEERENRRKLVLSAKRLKDAKDPALWDATRWKEKVVREPEHGFPAFQLHRAHVIDPPDTTAGA